MSLRDVERVLDVFSWFYYQRDENSLLNVMKKENDSNDIVDKEEFDLIKVFLKNPTIPDYQKCDESERKQ